MREIDMAMQIASRTWRDSTAISDGALAILREIYSPHKFCGDEIECSRCGKLLDHKIHTGK